MHRVLIIPAAGLGSRLGSKAPKVLTPVNGRPMLDHLLALFRPFADTVAVIAHPSFADQVRAHLASLGPSGLPFDVFEQPSPTGMLDAILAAAPSVDTAAADQIWVVWCDQVALLPATVARLARAAETPPTPDLVFPTVKRPQPYIHFPRDAAGRITGVLQRREHDVMPADGESDVGLFALSAAAYASLRTFSVSVTPGPGTGERNFLPFIPWLALRGRVATIDCTDPREAVGINTPEELAIVEGWVAERTSAL